jgi:isopentenyldiphosphate isomerase
MDIEYLDLVDEHDVVLESRPITEVYAERLRNFRVVNAFVKNSDGALWTPRRVETKIRFPNCLDFAMGGHVQAGEGYDEAFAREVYEELNLDVHAVDHAVLGTLKQGEHGVSVFMRVYEIHQDSVPDYSTEDYSGYEWVRPEELLKRLEDGEPAKSDLAPLVRLYYAD